MSSTEEEKEWIDNPIPSPLSSPSQISLLTSQSSKSQERSIYKPFSFLTSDEESQEEENQEEVEIAEYEEFMLDGENTRNISDSGLSVASPPVKRIKTRDYQELSRFQNKALFDAWFETVKNEWRK